MGKGRRRSREPGKETSSKKFKRLKRRTKGKGERQKKTNAIKKDKKAEEDDIPLKKEDLTNEQFDHWKKGNKKDDADEKDVEEKVKSIKEEQPQVAKEEEVQEMAESKNGDEKVDDVENDGEEKESEEEQSQTKESKKEVEQSKEEEDVDEASQTKESKEEVEQSKEEVAEGKDDDDRNSEKKPDLMQVIKEMVVDQTNLVLMESEVDITLKKRHALTDAEINKIAFKMACRINQLHSHLNELLLGVLLQLLFKDPSSRMGKTRSLMCTVKH
ncbi:hypothetical protein GIB67_030586 [Kingdonia uniflora]|uniref:Uncharacterized protein n=1 Tax=Kingdonia uniflora TaxID=39325 RepID=A0A7J7PC31_9MAGN|nr:hypothetical protein GIB67_030586 [Kingdonia uniflora]